MIIPSTAIDIKNSLTRVPVSMAREMIERRAPEQRDVSTKKLQEYAYAMKNKEFVWDSGDTIALDTRQLLIDGQKRLLAQIEINIEGYYLLVFNVDPEAYRVKDQGNRTAVQTFKTAGMAYPNELPAATQWYHKITSGLLSGGRSGFASLPHYKCLQLAKQQPGLQKAVSFTMSYAPKIRKFFPAQLAAFIHVYGGVQDHKNADFIRALATGIGCTEKDGVYQLRERIMALRSRRETISPTKFNALLIKALNAWRKEREVLQLRWLNGEAFPTMDL